MYHSLSLYMCSNVILSGRMPGLAFVMCRNACVYFSFAWSSQFFSRPHSSRNHSIISLMLFFFTTTGVVSTNSLLPRALFTISFNSVFVGTVLASEHLLKAVSISCLKSAIRSLISEKVNDIPRTTWVVPRLALCKSSSHLLGSAYTPVINVTSDFFEFHLTLIATCPFPLTKALVE